MAVIIQGIDIPKKHYMNGYYISDDGKVFDVSRKTVVGKAVQIPSGARLIDANSFDDFLGVEDRDIYCKNVVNNEVPIFFEEESE